MLELCNLGLCHVQFLADFTQTFFHEVCCARGLNVVVNVGIIVVFLDKLFQIVGTSLRQVILDGELGYSCCLGCGFHANGVCPALSHAVDGLNNCLHWLFQCVVKHLGVAVDDDTSIGRVDIGRISFQQLHSFKFTNLDNSFHALVFVFEVNLDGCAECVQYLLLHVNKVGAVLGIYFLFLYSAIGNIHHVCLHVLDSLFVQCLCRDNLKLIVKTITVVHQTHF